MREKIISQAKAWLDKNEKDGSFKEIIDIYNSHKPHPRGYKVKYTDSWCAAFVSALAIKCNMTDIIPLECSCGQMINLAKKMGIWQENDQYIPKKADIILYDWGDSGIGDNKAWPDHVGIVETVENNVILVIEGNINNSVGYRRISVNGKKIRGFICPKYIEEKTEIKVTYYPEFKGATNSIVDALKSLKIDSSYKHRKQIALKNGITAYSGKANENLKMLALLKEGKLIKE